MPATATVTTNLLNLRQGPGTEFPKIGELRRGDQLTVLEAQETWLRVRAHGQTGFVHKNFVFVPQTEVPLGFLRERPEIQQAPLAPAPGDMIRLPARPSPEQRLAAAAWNARGGALRVLSDAVAVARGAAVAVLCVESAGQAFGPEGMIIRFENHVFGRELRKRNSPRLKDFPRHFAFKADEPWKAHEFRPAPGGPWGRMHASQAREWEVLAFARNWDDTAALCSISMGLAQVMGFNHASVGYQSVQEMFAALENPASGERSQVISLFDFVKGPAASSPMLDALRRKDYVAFAHRYNGPGQALAYGERIEKCARAFDSLVA
jgi:hypothetical protein